MYPDIRNATVGDEKAIDLVYEEWIDEEYIPKVQLRAEEIIKLRKLSSAGSAANAAIDHMRDWCLGSDEWQSISILTDGSQYNIPAGLMFSMPCTTHNGVIKPILDLEMDDEITQKRLKVTIDELVNERFLIEHMM